MLVRGRVGDKIRENVPKKNQPEKRVRGIYSELSASIREEGLAVCRIFCLWHFIFTSWLIGAFDYCHYHHSQSCH